MSRTCPSACAAFSPRSLWLRSSCLSAVLFSRAEHTAAPSRSDSLVLDSDRHRSAVLWRWGRGIREGWAVSR